MDTDMAMACYQELIHAQYRQSMKTPFIPMACPDTGSFIGWKKCYAVKSEEAEDYSDSLTHRLRSHSPHVIVKILIPDDAKRSSGFSRKCRCDKAIVLEIQTVDGDPLNDNIAAYSRYDPSFKYIKGKTVVPKKPFCEDRFEECASGIHFFITREEAVRYIG